MELIHGDGKSLRGVIDSLLYALRLAQEELRVWHETSPDERTLDVLTEIDKALDYAESEGHR